MPAHADAQASSLELPFSGSSRPVSIFTPDSVKRGFAGRLQNSRKRIFSLEVVFWSFLDQALNPTSFCREAVRKLIAHVRRDG